jgi:uncharacterized protein YndB with AHSA1/START domain
MIRRIIIGITFVLALAVVGFVIRVSLLPNSYTIERSTTIKATPETIFPLVNDFQKWDKWSPFVELDPQAKVTISEPSAGKGAKMTWDGNDQVGAGEMLVRKSEPNELVLMEQSFSRPQQAACDVVFTFVPTASETKVTWQFNGNYDSFVTKAMCYVMDMEKMLGPKLEQGLAGIKREAEKGERSTKE